MWPVLQCLLVTNFGNYVKSMLQAYFVPEALANVLPFVKGKVSDGYVYSVLGTGVFNSDGAF